MDTPDSILDAALEAHGGKDKWRTVQTIGVSWTFRGLMFKLRLREAQLRNLSAVISTQKPAVEIGPFLTADGVGSFSPGRVQLTNSTGQRSLQSPRARFGGLRTLLWWDDLELLYFCGYVLWNYSLLPFVLTWPGVKLTVGTPHQENGEEWKRLDAEFPPELATHSIHQSFFFDSTGLLRRHDYHVAIMSKLARGARYIHSYATVDGLKLPSRIEIKLRLSGDAVALWPSLGFVDFDSFKPTFASPA